VSSFSNSKPQSGQVRYSAICQDDLPRHQPRTQTGK
jgi:hypothetical protein